VIIILKSLGWLLAKSPLPVVEILARFFGNFIYTFLPKRVYVLESNLHHAFPERSEQWRKSMIRENTCRLAEMGLLVLALPYLSSNQLVERIRIHPNNRKRFNEVLESGKPTLLLVPHFTLYEFLPMIPSVMGWKSVNIAAIFRPLKNKAINQWLKETREKFGVRLISRKRGLNQAKEVLQTNGVLGVLFDQNARGGGTLMPFFGRIASTSELPRILAQHYHPNVYLFHPRRLSFWNAQIELHSIPFESPKEIPHLANRWLEENFSQNDDICADWLWMHNRWRIQDAPTQRFSLTHRKQDLDFSKIHVGYRLWVRLDDRVEFARETLPLINTLKKGRRDAKITLICTPEVKEALPLESMGDSLYTLPPLDQPDRLNYIQSLKDHFPDTLLMLTQSPIADAEAHAIQAPQCFGLRSPNTPRPALTQSFQTDECTPLLDAYKAMLQHFGLKEEDFPE